MTVRDNLVDMLRAARRGFEEEGGSPLAINGALLVIAAALVWSVPKEMLDYSATYAEMADEEAQ